MDRKKRNGLTAEARVSLWAALCGLVGLGLLMVFDGLPILKAVCLAVILAVLVHHFLGGVDTHITARGVRAAGSTGFLLIAVWFLNMEFERQGTPEIDPKKLAEVVAPDGSPEDVAETAENIIDAFSEDDAILPSLSLVDADVVTLTVDNAVFAGFNDAADHWYQLNIDSPGRYTIRTSRPIDDIPLVDTQLFLYGASLRSDPSANWLGEDDDGGEGTYSLLAEYLHAGTYYLKVSSYYQYRGNYSLVIEGNDTDDSVIEPSTETAPFASPPISSLSDTQGIAPNGEAHSNHFEGEEVHWYVLVIDQLGVYNISTSGEEAGPDTVIELFDSNGVMVGYDDDGAEMSRYSMLVEELPSGTYYIGVTSYYDLPGTYELTVTSEPSTDRQGGVTRPDAERIRQPG